MTTSTPQRYDTTPGDNDDDIKKPSAPVDNSQVTRTTSAPPPYPNESTGSPTSAPIGSGAQPTVVNSATVVYVTDGNFGPYPARFRCPHCHADMVTEVQYSSGLLTWLLAALCFIVGFWLCCWIPFVVDSCRDVEHYCSNCKAFLGVSKRI